jgi:3-deoxy-D-manno-octulosonate 8-phosphate phosphatase KdsC-like HAD superfamily phosphatase
MPIMTSSMTDSAVKAALAAIACESTTAERIKMLIEMAQGFQKKPKTTQNLRHAVRLFYRAYQMCGEDYVLLKVRAKVGMAGALQMIPNADSQLLQQVKVDYEDALPILQKFGTVEEVAEVQMNLGLILQFLAANNLARISDSIHAYHEALRVFIKKDYPEEYAILHNNIAIAYLSIPRSS